MGRQLLSYQTLGEEQPSSLEDNTPASMAFDVSPAEAITTHAIVINSSKFPISIRSPAMKKSDLISWSS